jgi:hypothetical protein
MYLESSSCRFISSSFIIHHSSFIHSLQASSIMSSGRFFSVGVARAEARVVARCQAVHRARWCLARTSRTSSVLELMEAGYFAGGSDSMRCRLLVDLTETSAGKVAEWRRLGWLGEVVLGVDAAGEVWAMEEGRDGGGGCAGGGGGCAGGGDEPVAPVGVYRRLASAEDAAGLIAVRGPDVDA